MGQTPRRIPRPRADIPSMSTFTSKAVSSFGSFDAFGFFFFFLPCLVIPTLYISYNIRPNTHSLWCVNGLTILSRYRIDDERPRLG